MNLAVKTAFCQLAAVGALPGAKVKFAAGTTIAVQDEDDIPHNTVKEYPTCAWRREARLRTHLRTRARAAASGSPSGRRATRS